MTMRKLSSVITFLLIVIHINAQVTDINPIGFSDAQTLGFKGAPKTVTTETFNVEIQGTLSVKAEQTKRNITTFHPNGNIESSKQTDENGLMINLTTYTYNETKFLTKKVSTTYNQQNERTLQTLYSYTQEGLCAQMRLTDALAVTICTIEVSHGNLWAEATETFNDGETRTTTYTYNKQGLLSSILTKSNADIIAHTKTQYSGDLTKSSQKIKNGNTTISIKYKYEFDDEGNWIIRTTFTNGTISEICQREIIYY